MGHGHSHAPLPKAADGGSERFRAAQQVTVWGALLSLVLSLAKLALGLMARSQALVADGIHSLSDLVSDAVVWLGMKIASKPADDAFPFGRGKVETLAALIVGLLLGAGAVVIMVGAVTALTGEDEGLVLAEAPWALAAAVASVLTKEALYRWTRRVGERINSLPVVANAWHHRSDGLSSLAAAIGIAGAAWLGLPWLDPVAAIIVGIMILKAAWGILGDGVGGIVDRSVDETIRAQILSLVLGDTAVADAHDLRARSVGSRIFADLHVVVHPDMTVREACDVSHRLEKEIRSAVPEVERVLIHVEPARGNAILPVPGQPKEGNP